jgi:hypothetical protein
MGGVSALSRTGLTGAPAIGAAATSVAAFVDKTRPAQPGVPSAAVEEFERRVGGLVPTSEASHGIRRAAGQRRS